MNGCGSLKDSSDLLPKLACCALYLQGWRGGGCAAGQRPRRNGQRIASDDYVDIGDARIGNHNIPHGNAEPDGQFIDIVAAYHYVLHRAKRVIRRSATRHTTRRGRCTCWGRCRIASAAGNLDRVARFDIVPIGDVVIRGQCCNRHIIGTGNHSQFVTGLDEIITVRELGRGCGLTCHLTNTGSCANRYLGGNG